MELLAKERRGKVRCHENLYDKRALKDLILSLNGDAVKAFTPKHCFFLLRTMEGNEKEKKERNKMLNVLIELTALKIPSVTA